MWIALEEATTGFGEGFGGGDAFKEEAVVIAGHLSSAAGEIGAEGDHDALDAFIEQGGGEGNDGCGGIGRMGFVGLEVEKSPERASEDLTEELGVDGALAEGYLGAAYGVEGGAGGDVEEGGLCGGVMRLEGFVEVFGVGGFCADEATALA